VASLGLPAIVIPKVNLPGEHQVMNARALARCGGAVVLYEETRLDEGEGSLTEHLDGDVLAGAILSLLGDPERRAAMSAAARSFISGDPLDVIRAAVLADVRGETAPARLPPPMPIEPALLTNAALLSRLEQAVARDGASYRVEREIASADDLAYYVSCAASLLASASWESRNLGVKLIGLLQARDKAPLIEAILNDRRPAPWYKRVAGGDFEQVGFVRRNAVTALARLGVVTPGVEAVLLAALSDPYYEVRAEAAHAIAALDGATGEFARAQFISRLTRVLRDRWLEVAAAAAETLGQIGHESDALPVLVALQNHRYWLVRSAALRGLRFLVERGRAGDLAELERQIRGYVLTATDFRPEFMIKTAYARVLEAIATRREQDS